MNVIQTPLFYRDFEEEKPSRKLSIAYGNNRHAKMWTNKIITYHALRERLKVTIRTPESAEEYARLPKAQRDMAKDHGGFVAGVLKGGRRKIDTVESRSMVALDGESREYVLYIRLQGM